MNERFMARVQDNLVEPVPHTHNIKLTIYVIIRLVWLQLPHYSWPSCLITDLVNTESMMRQESHRTLRQRVKKPGFTSQLAECTMLGGISAMDNACRTNYGGRRRLPPDVGRFMDNSPTHQLADRQTRRQTNSPTIKLAKKPTHRNWNCHQNRCKIFWDTWTCLSG